MKILIKIVKWIVYLLVIPIVYLIISFILTGITTNKTDENSENEQIIYLSTNGVHLDIIIQKKDIDDDLLQDLVYLKNENYISFGWGDENFYINTPTWNDLTISNALGAMFLKGPTLIHITRFQQKRKSWTKVSLSKSELQNITRYISESFKRDEHGNKIILKDAGYSTHDNFYKANGNFSCFKTCNSWVNDAFKKSGLKACLWTPFDFGLINKYE